jgi:diguanylate cyclase (GGDEF)-like protein/PAS domain S-box-containing protein
MADPDQDSLSQGSILVIGATPDSLRIISEHLHSEGYAVQQAPDGRLALCRVRVQVPDLILLDIAMPGMDAFEVCRQLKADKATRGVPVIFLADRDDAAGAARGLKLGARDYIGKPCEREELVLKVRTQLELQTLRAGLESRVRLRTAQLETAANALRDEISMRRKAEEALELAGKVFDASFDAIIVTDVQGIIMAVNPAFTRISGYTREDVLGKNPNFLKSDRHDDGFYESKWSSLGEKGHWTGEVWNRRKDGNVVPMMETISACKDKSGAITNYISVIIDISEMKDAQTLIKFLAYHDPLTGLPNRIVAREHFDGLLVDGGSASDMVAVICFDLDRFKIINDSIGHAIGDQVLKILAGKFLSSLNDGDKITRQGGDEFLLISGKISGLDQAIGIAQLIIELVDQELIVDGHRLSISASLGIAVYPDHGKTLDDLLRNAENALYQAKKDGGNTYRFFTEDMGRKAMRKLQMQTLLRAALANGELDVFYQPKIELKTGAIIGAEALLRWHNIELGHVSPADFIPCAEESGLIHPIGEWVLNKACFQVGKWRNEGLGNVHVSVNLSGHQFLDKNLVKIVEHAIHGNEIPAELIELEVTESTLMGNVNYANLVLQSLKDIGVTISLDDFGTGYSSLSYLKNLPVDTLKIDKSFVDEVHASANDAAIALTIIALSRNLGMSVVAEGVENREQYAFLKKHGCDIIQGYYISKPLPAPAFEELLRFGYSKDLKGNVA